MTEQQGEILMLLADLDRYLKERGVVSLHLAIDTRGYSCVARTAHGRTITAIGHCDAGDAIDQVLVTLSGITHDCSP